MGPSRATPCAIASFLDLFVNLLVEKLAARGTTRAEDAQGIPTQSHISPSILLHEDEFDEVLRMVASLEIPEYREPRDWSRDASSAVIPFATASLSSLGKGMCQG